MSNTPQTQSPQNFKTNTLKVKTRCAPSFNASFSASVHVDEQLIAEISQGLLLFLGAGQGDSEQDLSYILHKTLHLRIFEDDVGKMNRSLIDIGGQLLIVSQFTLYGDARKGRRPSFTQAMEPEQALMWYKSFIEKARAQGIDVHTGQFGAMMHGLSCQ